MIAFINVYDVSYAYLSPDERASRAHRSVLIIIFNIFKVKYNTICRLIQNI